MGTVARRSSGSRRAKPETPFHSLGRLPTAIGLHRSHPHQPVRGLQLASSVRVFGGGWSQVFDTRTPVRVAVLGSLVFDISLRVSRVPDTHETILADSAQISAGGKGLCQAVAARRLGATVDAIGAVGDDVFGEYLLGVLDEEGIGRDNVSVTLAGTHLGIPIITPDGNNRIIGVPRASFELSLGDVQAGASVLRESDVLLVQGETPLDCIVTAIGLSRLSTLIVWNPAPARFTVEQMLGDGREHLVAWLTPNETEAGILTGTHVTDVPTALQAARIIRDDYPAVGVAVTLGAQGAVAIDRNGLETVAAPFTVNAIDPTAAGDCFTAAFAVSLAWGANLEEALTMGCAAGALSVTRRGAMPSIPTLAHVFELVNERDPG